MWILDWTLVVYVLSSRWLYLPIYLWLYICVHVGVVVVDRPAKKLSGRSPVPTTEVQRVLSLYTTSPGVGISLSLSFLTPFSPFTYPFIDLPTYIPQIIHARNCFLFPVKTPFGFNEWTNSVFAIIKVCALHFLIWDYKFNWDYVFELFELWRGIIYRGVSEKNCNVFAFVHLKWFMPVNWFILRFLRKFQ